MTLVFLGVFIIIAASYAAYSAANDIDKKRAVALDKVKNTEWISVETSSFEIGYKHIYTYPEFTPNEIIHEPDDVKAEKMIERWSRKVAELTHKQSIQEREDGWFFEAKFTYGEKEYRTRSTMLFPSKNPYTNISKTMKENKVKKVWINRKKPKQAFLVKPTEKDTEIYYSRMINKELCMCAFIIFVGLAISLSG